MRGIRRCQEGGMSGISGCHEDGMRGIRFHDDGMRRYKTVSRR